MDAMLRLLTSLALAVVVVAGNGLRQHWRGARATIAPDGLPEIEIIVDHGYHPAEVRVPVGKSVRLLCHRHDGDACGATACVCPQNSYSC